MSWKDVPTIASAALSIVSLIAAILSVGRVHRIRSRLSTEVDIWQKLPEDSESRRKMLLLVERSAKRLSDIEDPTSRNRRRAETVEVLAFSCISLGVSFMFYRQRERGYGFIGLAI